MLLPFLCSVLVVDGLRGLCEQVLGKFIAQPGRERVCTLAKANLEIPTGFAGVAWEPLDEGG